MRVVFASLALSAVAFAAPAPEAPFIRTFSPFLRITARDAIVPAKPDRCLS